MNLSYTNAMFRDGGKDVGGPVADHTFETDVGMYALMEATGHSPQSEAILISQPLHPSFLYCLTLFSFMPAEAELGVYYHNPVDDSRVEAARFSGTGATWDKVSDAVIKCPL